MNPTTLHFIIAACWFIFLVYWLISALNLKAVSQRKSFASSLPYRIPLLLGCFCLWDPRMVRLIPGHLIPATYEMLLAATAVCIVGLGITLWARFTLAGNWSSTVTFKQGHELIRKGPYRFVRHPIYTGILVMAIAVAMENGRTCAWVGVGLWGLSMWIKLKQEEALMLQHFPDQYPTYQKEVKALVPFVL